MEALVQELRTVIDGLTARIVALESLVAAASTMAADHGSKITTLEEKLQKMEKKMIETSGSIVDTKLLNRPKEFAGSHDDWKDWSFKFIGYTGALSADLRDEMRLAIETDVVEKIADILDPMKKQRCLQLYYILVMLSTSTAAEKVRACEEGNGYQIWKAFCDEWDPRRRGDTGRCSLPP
jgi:hypothetical protein